ncbi:hypothetical protein AAC387_Pa11g0418 [Persea americana]
MRLFSIPSASFSLCRFSQTNPYFSHIHHLLHIQTPNHKHKPKTLNLTKTPKPSLSSSSSSSSSSIVDFKDDVVLTEKQKEVLKAVVDGRSVFITGSAGTGKSFLLHHIIHLLRLLHSPRNVFVTASTGVAACALNGLTLHSFAGVGLATDHSPELLLHKVRCNIPAFKRWRFAKALVVDEISMIDGQLFDRLEFIARSLRPGRKVWGGIQLVVAGDFFQLPPVNSPDPNREFAFEADSWSNSFHLQVELTHVFRQSDARLVKLLQAIRKGRSDDIDWFRFLNSCFVEPHFGEREKTVTRLYPRNEDVRRVNEEKLRSLGGEVITYIAQDEGEESGKKQLKQGIAPQELELCLGARVMLLKNLDPMNGLVNGATGTVTGFVKSRRKVLSSICAKQVLPRVQFDSKLEIEVEPDSWDVMDGDVVLATRRQVPLTLAWALSIHKCQGLTLDRLHTDLSRAFGCGMVYVALSRVRSLDGLCLSGFSPRKIKVHPKVLDYSQQAFGN